MAAADDTTAYPPACIRRLDGSGRAASPRILSPAISVLGRVSMVGRFQNCGGRTRMRTQFGSITEKCPAQSWRDESTPAKNAPASLALGMGRRKRTIPHFAGRRARQASSPKSLSKVRRMRSSRTARASTSASGAPGESARTDARSCPATRSAAMASPGKFSLAKNRTAPRSVRRHWIDFFRAQRIAGVA